MQSFHKHLNRDRLKQIRCRFLKIHPTERNNAKHHYKGKNTDDQSEWGKGQNSKLTLDSASTLTDDYSYRSEDYQILFPFKLHEVEDFPPQTTLCPSEPWQWATMEAAALGTWRVIGGSRLVAEEVPVSPPGHCRGAFEQGTEHLTAPWHAYLHIYKPFVCVRLCFGSMCQYFVIKVIYYILKTIKTITSRGWQ